MKRSHLITIVVLAVLVASAWIAAFAGFGDAETAEYKEHIQLAQDYSSRGLFWKAGQEYQEALEISGSEEIWAAMLDAYASSYAQGDDSYDDYLDAAVDAVAACGDNEGFVLQLASLYTGDEDYKSATKVLKEAISEGLDSAEIKNALIAAEYAYEIRWGSYEDYLPYVNGFYRVCRSGIWFYLDESGGTERYADAMVLGAVGDDDIRVVGTQDQVVLVDEDTMPQGIISGKLEDAGMYEEGLLPLKLRGTYGYYNLVGDKVYGDYEQAGSFEKGKAAVKQNGQWFLIDEDGERVSEASYEEIVLTLDGTWTEDRVMLAKMSGQYRIFDQDEEQVSDFSCTDIDIVTDDGLIAFCADNRWGYVDTDGEIAIEPAYQQAKSFSNGLAAVFNGTAWGFINEDGVVVIDYQFQDAGYFTEGGTCMVKTDEGWQVLERAVTD